MSLFLYEFAQSQAVSQHDCSNLGSVFPAPSVSVLTSPDGSFRTLDVSLEKALWTDRWSVVLDQARLYRHQNARTVAAFDNFEVGTKVAAYRNVPHEFILTPALFTTFATGSRKIVDPHTGLQPGLLYGKGLGDLRVNWLRPFAVQGDFEYQISITGERERQVLYDAVLEYSVPYLNFIRRANAGYQSEHQLRRGHSAGAIFGDVFPFLEFNGATPVGSTAGQTTTVFRPGALYMGKYFQLSLAADLALRGYQRPRRKGAVILLDVFLDELTPAIAWTPFGKRHRRTDHNED